MSKQTKPEQQFHFFGSTGLNWAKGATREEVLAALARMAGTDQLKRQLKANGGLYAWTCRVELPAGAPYALAEFAPVNVPCNTPRQHQILTYTNFAEKVPDSVPLSECQLHDPYGLGTRPAVADAKRAAVDEARDRLSNIVEDADRSNDDEHMAAVDLLLALNALEN